uniref:C2 domain-containing protein n=1 Tax=Vitrella brassicaformis TaxID=1169539 RepID=A0A7S1KE61_9ALVE
MAKQAEGYANQEAHLKFLRQQLESVQEVLKQVQQEKGAAEGAAIAARRDLATALQDLEYFKKHAGQMGGPSDDKYRSLEQQLAALRKDNEGLQKQLAMMRQALQEEQTRVADLQNTLRMRETAPRHPEMKEPPPHVPPPAHVPAGPPLSPPVPVPTARPTQPQELERGYPSPTETIPVSPPQAIPPPPVTMPDLIGTLSMTCWSAVGVRAADAAPRGGEATSDPYCKVLVPSPKGGFHTWNTETIVKTLHPIWKETKDFQVPLPSPHNTTDAPSEVLIEVWDSDWGKDNFLGEVRIPFPQSFLRNCYETLQRRGGVRPLLEKQLRRVQSNPQKAKEAAEGCLCVELLWSPPENLAESAIVPRTAYDAHGGATILPARPEVSVVVDPGLEQAFVGKLTVKCLSAFGLRAADSTMMGLSKGLSDPYCKVCVSECEKSKPTTWRTKTINETLDPVWNEANDFFISFNQRPVGEAGSYVVEVWDADAVMGVNFEKDDFLGEITLPIPKNATEPTISHVHQALMGNPAKEDKNALGKVTGQLSLEVQWAPFLAAPDAKPTVLHEMGTAAPFSGKLIVVCVAATALVPPGATKNSPKQKQNPVNAYCKMFTQCTSTEKPDVWQSKVVKHNNSPVWQQDKEWDVNLPRELGPSESLVLVEVWASRLGSDAFLGQVAFPAPTKRGTTRYQLPLTGDPEKGRSSGGGSLAIDITWRPHIDMDKEEPEIVECEVLAEDGESLPYVGNLRIKCISASGLRAADTTMFGRPTTSDPYAKVCLATGGPGSRKHSWQTKVVKKNLSPVWDEQHGFYINSQTSPNEWTGESKPTILIEVFDSDLGPDDFLGEVHLPFPIKGGRKTFQQPLQSNKKKSSAEAQGLISLEIEWEPRYELEEVTQQVMQVPDKGLTTDLSMAAGPPPPPQTFEGDFKIECLSAQGLRAADRSMWGFGKLTISDPFCRFLVPAQPKTHSKPQVWETSVKCKTLDPVWKESKSFKINWPQREGPSEPVLVEVWDSDTLGKDFLGEATFPLPQDISRPSVQEVTLSLQSNTQKCRDPAQGQLFLVTTWTPLHMPQQQAPSAGDMTMTVTHRPPSPTRPAPFHPEPLDEPPYPDSGAYQQPPQQPPQLQPPPAQQPPQTRKQGGVPPVDLDVASHAVPTPYHSFPPSSAGGLASRGPSGVGGPASPFQAAASPLHSTSEVTGAAGTPYQTMQTPYGTLSQHQQQQQPPQQPPPAQPPVPSKLVVNIKEAHDLAAADGWMRKSDPYMVVKLRANGWESPTQQTEHISQNLNPKWNKSLTFTDLPPGAAERGVECVCEVYDYDMIKSRGGDDFLGCMTVRVPPHSLQFGTGDVVERLVAKEGVRSKVDVKGEIVLGFSWQQ